MIAAATPIAIAQRNSAPVGFPAGGISGIASENEPMPVQLLSPDENERPDPGSEKSRQEHDAHHSSAEPHGLHHQKSPREGRSEEGTDGREATCGTHDDAGRLGRIVLEQVDGKNADAAAECYQRCLRAEHDPETEGRQRREDDAGELDRQDRARRLESLCRPVPARPRQEPDRQRNQQATESEERNRPPGGLGVESELAGKGSVHVVLHLGNTFEEEQCSHRYRNPDDRAEREQHHVAPASQKGCRIGGSEVCQIGHSVLGAGVKRLPGWPREPPPRTPLLI